MIVCHCEVVSDREVRESIDLGARTLAQVCGATGAGRNCGGCVFSLKRLLCQHGRSVSATSFTEVASATG
ncbi:bacterioferritin-associated ferredoxin [Kribbella sp. VKM Ac-2568]|uniref:(2Fe-2S)-binding protein n=1 Tax=Kribbella sp. VKM Ac-2568 TaxID=2512219 RepID=UPI0010443723|nr:(2Fe-2S)-binding protein [Kribbella sp. VKM Ac-2568]TCM47802.1 bacterioferritin-associated ferredoxin [Kribbella sp. VKM Ac-2568]